MVSVTYSVFEAYLQGLVVRRALLTHSFWNQIKVFGV